MLSEGGWGFGSCARAVSVATFSTHQADVLLPVKRNGLYLDFYILAALGKYCAAAKGYAVLSDSRNVSVPSPIKIHRRNRRAGVFKKPALPWAFLKKKKHGEASEECQGPAVQIRACLPRSPTLASAFSWRSANGDAVATGLISGGCVRRNYWRKSAR